MLVLLMFLNEAYPSMQNPHFHILLSSLVDTEATQPHPFPNHTETQDPFNTIQVNTSALV